MSVSNEFLSYIVDQLSTVGPVNARKMFGGAGVYLNGLMFGLVSSDVLYLKVDDSNRPDYEKAGSQIFQPWPDKPNTMPYYEVPADVLDDRMLLKQWAEKSVKVARKGKKK